MVYVCHFFVGAWGPRGYDEDDDGDDRGGGSCRRDGGIMKNKQHWNRSGEEDTGRLSMSQARYNWTDGREAWYSRDCAAGWSVNSGIIIGTEH